MGPEQGGVWWVGKAIASVRSEYQAGLAFASHEPALKADLTALENLHFAVGLKRRVTLDELRASLERTGVAACADLPARVLSAGEHRPARVGRVFGRNTPFLFFVLALSPLLAARTGRLSGPVAIPSRRGG